MSIISKIILCDEAGNPVSERTTNAPVPADVALRAVEKLFPTDPAKAGRYRYHLTYVDGSGRETPPTDESVRWWAPERPSGTMRIVSVNTGADLTEKPGSDTPRFRGTGIRVGGMSVVVDSEMPPGTVRIVSPLVFVSDRNEKPVKPPVPTVRLVTDPNEYPKDEWYRRPGWCDVGYIAKNGFSVDGAQAHVTDALDWYVHESFDLVASGRGASAQEALIAADAAYRKALQERADRDAEAREAAKPPVPAVRTAQTGEYPVNEWFRRPGSVATANIFERGSDHRSGLRAGVGPDRWAVYDAGCLEVAGGSEGSFEANLIAADAAYRKALQERADRDAKAAVPKVRTMADTEYPKDEWYRRPGWSPGRACIYETGSDSLGSVHAWVRGDFCWIVYDEWFHTVAKGKADSFEEALLAADAAYRAAKPAARS